MKRRGGLSKIGKILRSKKGSLYIYGAFLIMALILILSVLFEYFRIHGTISRVERAYEKAMISVAITNYDEIFTSMRESGQTGGVFEGGNETELGSSERPVWTEITDMGDVSEELASLLEIQNLEEGLHSFDPKGNWLYSVEDMTMVIHQTENYKDEPRYEIEGDFRIEIPVYLMGKQVSVFSTRLPSKAVWKNKL